MKTTRIAAALGLGALVFAIIWALPPQAAHAQCGPEGGECGPGEKEKKDRPTPTDVFKPAVPPVPAPGIGQGTLIALPTSPGTPRPTIDPSVYATARACWDDIYRKTPAPELPTASWGDIQVDAPQCIPTPVPTLVPPISVTYVAGPVFVAPGVKNVIIAVLILGGLLGALLFIVRVLMTPGPPNKPNKPNK
jgi:hypothetical protein